MKLGLGASLSQSRDIGRLATLGIGASAGLTVQMFIAEVAAAYEVARLIPAPPSICMLAAACGGSVPKQTLLSLAR